MGMRSWLLVAADKEQELDNALATHADVVVVDLSVVTSSQARLMARAMACAWLEMHEVQVTTGAKQGRWARIGGLDDRGWREDLNAIMPGKPDGIILPRAADVDQVQALSAAIYEHEQRLGIPVNSTQVIPQISDLPGAALTVSEYIKASLPRLAGLSWSAEALAYSIGAKRMRDARGKLCDSYRWARTQCLLAAHARGVMAIDAPFRKIKDSEGLARCAHGSRADGFTGMVALDGDQVGGINENFTPNDKDREEAEAIIAAFESDPARETARIGQRTVDKASLERAKSTLGLAA